eukprot:7269996-Heterocapsa_arctica.AAC.1
MSGRIRGHKALAKRLSSACQAVVKRLPCSREGCWPGTEGKHGRTSTPDCCKLGSIGRNHMWCAEHTVGQAFHKVGGMERRRRRALGLNTRQ